MTDTPFSPRGKHLIDGAWTGSAETFASAPVDGPSHAFAVGGAPEVGQAARAAERAFETYGAASREDRAAFLDAIADEIEARAAAITDIGSRETGLPPARLEGERGR
ncbi:MAG: aldehyde dehydrogenase family protein, partial [Caenispirillum sp.]|nr:aldehyde dehydrogenase family protein [Caenispirillum sp.]